MCAGRRPAQLGSPTSTAMTTSPKSPPRTSGQQRPPDKQNCSRWSHSCANLFHSESFCIITGKGSRRHCVTGTTSGDPPVAGCSLRKSRERYLVFRWQSRPCVWSLSYDRSGFARCVTLFAWLTVLWHGLPVWVQASTFAS